MFALLGGSALAAPQPTPTPDAKALTRAYEARHAGVNHVGGAVTEPRLVHQVRPEFPESARKQRITISPIIAIVVITREGTVLDPVLLRSSTPELDAEFLKALRRWRYEPAQLEGKPVDAFLTVTLSWLF
jgi:periplasmic protein TonB